VLKRERCTPFGSEDELPTDPFPPHLSVFTLFPADTDAYKLSMQAAIQQLYPDATVK